ncbi:MAG: long-chain fatty acid--CoA ligase [Verrucomicrobiota bacterium]|jgi:long-chain acyl-CoA synthetase
MLNIATILETQAQRNPGRTAIVLGDTRLSYAQLNGAASQVANGLVARGIQPGDKVALSCPNLPYFPIVYFGILKAGAVVVPLNVLLKRREIAYHLNDAEARAYFCFEGSPQLPMGEEGHAGFNDAAGCEHLFIITADPAAPSPIENLATLGMLMHEQSPDGAYRVTDNSDTAVILYTSGTTGQPKGAELTHDNMLINALVVARLLHYTADDVNLVVLPLFHSFGQTVQMNAGLVAGATLVLLPRFDAAAVLGLMQKESITTFCGVPTMYWGLMQCPDVETFDLGKIADQLRVCVSGGAALPLEILKGFEERFRVPILEGYGLSETSPVACFNQLDQERKPGSIGTPIWGVEMKIVDDADHPLPVGEPGEVLIRGHNVMKGYYRRPEDTAAVMAKDWFHTGDIGKTDEDGYFYIVDRSKDMIIRGGFNVYPREIEEVLMTHPAVSLSAVIGVPDAKSGEEIKAFVILKEGQSATEDELLGWGKEQMASYKYPRLLEIRESLPMNATGKILKRELRD